MPLFQVIAVSTMTVTQMARVEVEAGTPAAAKEIAEDMNWRGELPWVDDCWDNSDPTEYEVAEVVPAVAKVEG